MTRPVFVGFGFGAIQAGLFLYEAFRTHRFQRLVVAEVVPEVVAAVRGNGGRYGLNVATPSGIERTEVSGIEIFNPRVDEDRRQLITAIGEATEMATALPSVRFFEEGDLLSPAALLAEGLAGRPRGPLAPRAILYTAENHNHAAEILEASLATRLGHEAPSVLDRCQVLNTVIGKMSGVVTDPAQIRAQALCPLTPGAGRCILVEEFNRILISRIRWPDFDRGLSVFQERGDLLPFEEAKLYGHNATHALLGYLARRCGYPCIADAGRDPRLLAIARGAFLEESGAALCRRHRGVDPLFTPAGYQAYAEDLLVRMVNPHLRDAVERVIRDPHRKLGWDDRLVGTMRMVLAQGLTPHHYALGAAAAVEWLAADTATDYPILLEQIWGESVCRSDDARRVQDLIREAMPRLQEFHR